MYPFGWWWNKYKKSTTPSCWVFGNAEEIFFEPSHGFMFWCISDDGDLVITKCCGDGRYWKDKAYKMYEAMNTGGGIVVRTNRNLRAYKRFFGGNVFKEEIVDGIKYYWLRYDAHSEA